MFICVYLRSKVRFSFSLTTLLNISGAKIRREVRGRLDIINLCLILATLEISNKNQHVMPANLAAEQLKKDLH